MKLREVLVAAAVSSLMVGTTPGLGAPESEEVSQAGLTRIESEFRTGELTLRPLESTSRVGYLLTEDGFASFEFMQSKLFPISRAVPIRLEKLRLVNRHVEVRLKNEKLGDARVRLWPPYGGVLTEGTVKDLLLQFLQVSEGDFLSSMVIGNRRSHQYHSRSTNHLPALEDRDTLLTRDLAESRGYRRCSICFWKEPPIQDFRIEKQLGSDGASQYILYHPVLTADSLTDKLDRVGRNTLRGWPLALRGYEYRFQVVEGEEPNARAFPAGRVFVTRGLMDAIESDNELMMVLAHEIAHVERRHGYSQFRRAQAAKTASALLGILSGVFVMSRGGDLGDVASAVDVGVRAGAVASSIAISGYSRDFETEADSYALLFANEHPERRAAFENLLSKLEASAERDGLLSAGSALWDTHPEIQSRLARARSTRVESLGKTPRFVGLDADGEEVVSITFEAQSQASYNASEVRVIPRRNSISSFRGGTVAPGEKIVHREEATSFFVTIATTSLWPGQKSIDAIEVVDSEGTRTLYNQAPTTIGAADQLSARFEGGYNDDPLRTPISSASLPFFASVVSWVQRPR